MDASIALVAIAPFVAALLAPLVQRAARPFAGWVLTLGKRPGMPTIIPLPGASRPEQVRENAVEVELKALEGLSEAEIRSRRAERFYAIGRSGLQ